jgi:porin
MDGDPNPIEYAGSIGVGGSVPFGGRAAYDTFGAAYFYTAISDELRGLPGQLDLRDEQGVEASYNLGVTPWFAVTADAQYVKPAFASVDDAVVLGLRALIRF